MSPEKDVGKSGDEELKMSKVLDSQKSVKHGYGGGEKTILQ